MDRTRSALSLAPRAGKNARASERKTERR
jgi:hypothetical protein